MTLFADRPATSVCTVVQCRQPSMFGWVVGDLDCPSATRLVHLRINVLATVNGIKELAEAAGSA